MIKLSGCTLASEWIQMSGHTDPLDARGGVADHCPHQEILGDLMGISHNSPRGSHLSIAFSIWCRDIHEAWERAENHGCPGLVEQDQRATLQTRNDRINGCAAPPSDWRKHNELKKWTAKCDTAQEQKLKEDRKTKRLKIKTELLCSWNAWHFHQKWLLKWLVKSNESISPMHSLTLTRISLRQAFYMDSGSVWLSEGGKFRAWSLVTHLPILFILYPNM